MMYNVKEKYAEFEEIKHYVTSLHEKLLALDKVVCRMVKERKGMSRDLSSQKFSEGPEIFLKILWKFVQKFLTFAQILRCKSRVRSESHPVQKLHN